jgi:hypothetical protein
VSVLCQDDLFLQLVSVLCQDDYSYRSS